MEQVHAIIEQLAYVLEVVGVAVILGGVVIAGLRFVRDGNRLGSWSEAYKAFRANLGRAILLGLELLVGADIIGTITSPLTFQSVGLLALVVLIRTFLSFALETEIEGCWPWQRRRMERSEAGASGPRDRISRD